MVGFSRFLAGILTIIMVCLVIIGPLWIAGKLETIEASQSGVVSRDEIHSTSNTTSTYEPFLEMNGDTEGVINPGAGGLDYGYSFNVGGATWDDPILKSYNYNGYQDYVEYTQETLSHGYIYLKGDFYSLAQLGIDGFYFSFISNNEYAFIQTRFLKLDVSYLEVDNYQVYYGQWDTGSKTGVTEYDVELTSTDLTEIMTMFNGVDPERQVLRLYVNFIIDDGSDFITDIQFEPDYYQVNTTTYENTTITSYEPFTQTITPYRVHKVSMILGGILILIVGWIASPWGERFDFVLPINEFVNRGSKRSKPNYRKRR